MPSNTPGTKKGNQSKIALSEANKGRPRGCLKAVSKVATRVRPIAAIAAKKNEFQIALVPASTAPGNSVQVRFADTICATGTPTDNAHTSSDATALPKRHGVPRCRRKIADDTAP